MYLIKLYALTFTQFRCNFLYFILIRLLFVSCRCTPPNKKNDYQKIYSHWCNEFEKYKSAMKQWQAKQDVSSSLSNIYCYCKKPICRIFFTFIVYSKKYWNICNIYFNMATLRFFSCKFIILCYIRQCLLSHYCSFTKLRKYLIIKRHNCKN